jgi:hypothetical protein
MYQSYRVVFPSFFGLRMNENSFMDSLPHDIRQERVAESGALTRALDESRNVPDLQTRRHLGFGLVLLQQPVVAVVGNVDAGLVGVNGAEGEVFGGDALFGERVEEGRLSDVREPDNTHLH